MGSTLLSNPSSSPTHMLPPPRRMKDVPFSYPKTKERNFSGTTWNTSYGGLASQECLHNQTGRVRAWWVPLMAEERGCCIRDSLNPQACQNKVQMRSSCASNVACVTSFLELS